MTLDGENYSRDIRRTNASLIPELYYPGSSLF